MKELVLSLFFSLSFAISVLILYEIFGDKYKLPIIYGRYILPIYIFMMIFGWAYLESFLVFLFSMFIMFFGAEVYYIINFNIKKWKENHRG